MASGTGRALLACQGLPMFMFMLKLSHVFWSQTRFQSRVGMLSSLPMQGLHL